MKQIRLYALALVVVFSATGNLLAESLQRVEPPFWWVGFEDTRLQLLIHGPDMAAYEPEIDAAGVTLAKVTRVESANYLFLDLEIAASTKPGKFEIIFRRGDGEKMVHAYELRARKAKSAERRGFSAADAIYLVTPDRFANGDPENDSIAGMADGLNRADKDGRHGGDIQGMIDHLDYMADMGFTALWLNPVLENDQPDTSYHGYATTDFYKVDPRYGTNKKFLELSETARAKGIGLIMDMIVNHSGSHHWWMADLPTGDWINFPDNYVNTNHRRTTLQDPYAADIDRRIFSDGWFVESMPDLNQRNPLLATYLIQNAIWWIEYAGLAGIRMDTYPYPDMHFMTEWTRRVMAEYPDFNVVGEEWSTNPVVTSYWQHGKVNPNGYVSYLPGVMDFPLQDALVKGLTTPEDWGAGLIDIYKMLANDVLYPAPGNLVVFPDNHDMSRIYTQLGEDKALLRMALAHTLTIRGIPQIYYGTEILMSNPGTEDHGVIRADFPGGWAGDRVSAFTGKGLSDAELGMQGYLRTLLNWRKGSSAIHHGKLRHFVPEDGVYVYFRYTDEEKVMVVLNKKDQARTLSVDRFAEMLAGARKGRDIVTGQRVDIGQGIALGPRSVTILEID